MPHCRSFLDPPGQSVEVDDLHAKDGAEFPGQPSLQVVHQPAGRHNHQDGSCRAMFLLYSTDPAQQFAFQNDRIEMGDNLHRSPFYPYAVHKLQFVLTVSV